MKRSIIILFIMGLILTSCEPGDSPPPISSSYTSSIPFGDTTPETMTFKLDRLSIVKTNDDSTDKPYLWVYYIVIDQDTIANGDYVKTVDPIGHDNITSADLDAGANVSISESIGLYQKQLNPIPLLDTSLAGTIVMGWEGDDTPSDTITEAYITTKDIINEFIEEQVNDLNFSVPTSSAITQLYERVSKKVYEIISDSVHWYKPGFDKVIGASYNFYTIKVGGLTDDDFQLVLTQNTAEEPNKYPEYRVDGRLSVDPVWDAVSRYSTTQTAVANNQLFMLARGYENMAIWKYDPASNQWAAELAPGPILSDAEGWSDVTNYSTIQTAVVDGNLFLLARGDAGITIWKYDSAHDHWSDELAAGPALSDAAGWSDVANYSTTQTVVVGDNLYLLARGDTGIAIWKYDTVNNRWFENLATGPALSDADGWSDPANYSTIQTAVVDTGVYLVARGDMGIALWRYDTGNNTWTTELPTGPTLSDAAGWNDVANYSTIQTAAIGNNLYLIARGDTGIAIWRYDIGNRAWSPELTGGPVLSDAAGWNDVANYSTIRIDTAGNNLYLLARSDTELALWIFNTVNNRWSDNLMGGILFSDAAGWDDVANYSTLRTAVVGRILYIMARSDTGLAFAKFGIEQ